MKKLLIATTNPGKFSEIKKFLSDLPFIFLSPKDLHIKVNPREDYPTFLENAKHKARFYGAIAKIPAIADDGGLEIDYLKGAPGVYSRRWVTGGDGASDQQLITHTLKKLYNVPLKKRGAQLRTVVALYLPNGKVYTATAKIRGVITEEPYQYITKGFPYRSLLFLPEIGKYYHSREMTKEEIEKYNHRAKALKKLKKYLT